MSDLKASAGSFATTSVDVEPTSEKGRAFFDERICRGAVSANFPKSRFGEVLAAAKFAGLAVEIV